MKQKIQELYTLEQLSSGASAIHRLHPSVKLLTTVVFIIVVVSFSRYDIGRLVPYILFPTVIMSLSETPYTLLLKRFLVALPFCIFAGVTNIFFDTEPAFVINTIVISNGVLSLVTIVFKSYLCVMTILILMSVTPLAELTNAMRRLRIPYIFTVMFEMTYRYIGVLFDEAHTIYTAYSLRSSERKGIKIADMGTVVGQLLLRSIDRADRIYNAMKCRGYALRTMAYSRSRIERSDYIFGIAVTVVCIGFRVVNVNALLVGAFGEYA
ncbi:MAG: cobalt ECF transporter T component CbiQ [Propionibacteriaceae bacterium]|nr:cobalt ECF transporter T component CbiQ [Propionibacteriaceae bacterium]